MAIAGKLRVVLSTAQVLGMKDTVAVYSPVYLPMSEVFVYRQLLGAAKAFQPIVLTHRLRHVRQFPFEPIGSM